MKIHQLPVVEALASVRSGKDGLSAAEAQRRLREFGPNRVEPPKRRPLLLRLLKEFTPFFSIILWIAAALGVIADWYDPGQGMARVAIAILAVILISGAFSFWQEHRVERTLAALQNLLPQRVEVLRDSAVVRLLADDVVVGDVILLAQGDKIPADCRVIEGFGLRVNNATVTGESMPQARDTAPTRGDDPLRSSNMLLAGTVVVSGQAKAVVVATGCATIFGKIAHLSQSAEEVTSPLRRQLAHLSRLIAFLAIAIGIVFFAIGTAVGVPFWQDFIFAIGLIVAMVPEGLLPTLTLALVLAAQRMARRQVLIRHLTSVETLGSATVICTDKTGTLTEGRMRVRRIFLGGEAHSPDALARRPDLLCEAHQLFLALALCHDVRGLGGPTEALLGDPMEVALVETAQQCLAQRPTWPRIDEISFDSDRMRQSVVHETPDGPILYCKGAVESVLPLCISRRDEAGIRALDEAAREAIVRAQEAMARQGLRVIAIASRALPPRWARDKLEQELVVLGLIGLEDPPRPEVPDAIRKCHKAGIKVIMVTGDHPETAQAIAREIGLIRSTSPAIFTGEHLRKLSATQLQLALDAPEIIFARATAEQKMRIVETLRNKNHVVAVTGDGVNDAPALKAAHIGVAMGLSGTEVAKEAADMVLLDDNFASIVAAIEEGRALFENIRRFLTYVLVHNVAELVPYLAFALFRIPLPLTPIQALCVDMGTDSLTALGLGVEAPDPESMRQPPRPQRERLLNLALGLRAYLFLGVIEAAAAMAAFWFVVDRGGWRYGQNLAADAPLYLAATTACLSAIIVMQIVNVFLCRSSIRSLLTVGISGNPLILWGVALELGLLLTINYVPLANLLLGTAPVPRELWLFLAPFAAAMVLLEEGRKWLVRR